jgi:hypothetical protein
MRKFMIILVAFALVVSACQNGPKDGKLVLGGNPSISGDGPTKTSSGAGDVPEPEVTCRPTSIVIYDDFSKSVDSAIALEVKEDFVKSLERDYVPCLVSVQLVRFGVGSVWNMRAKRYDFPPTLPCGDPDYKQLPAHVRNLTAYREKFRREHAEQCAAQDSSFKEKYDAAVASLKADLVSQEGQGDPNSCTSFANLVERIHDDAESMSDDMYFVIISDMKWDCHERKPTLLYEKGTIIQIADGRTDDKIKVSPLDESEGLKRLFPNAKVVQGVHAENAVTTLLSEVETLTARR